MSCISKLKASNLNKSKFTLYGKKIIQIGFLILIAFIVDLGIRRLTLLYGETVNGEIIEVSYGKQKTKVSIDNSVYRLTINEKNKKQLKKGDSIKLKKWNRYVVHSSFPFLGQSSIITLCLIGLITFYFKNKK